MTAKEVITKLGEFEDVEEPSVTSSDPNERKIARRLRIQRRLEALSKQARVEVEGIVERTLTEKQIYASAEVLEKLQLEGNEVVSSVKVANDAREIQRRREEHQIRDDLLKKLEENDKECTKRYEAINAKWPDLLASNDPLDIHAELEAQNARCLDILAKKDAVIAELRRELEYADLKFVNDQKKQSEDISLLIERIENQTTAIAKAYRSELALIDDAIDAERKMLLEVASEKWEALYRKICDDDRGGIEKRKEIMKEYEQEMKKVLIEHQEEFRAQKIKLELECQRLQQEVQNMKAMCLMNSEKLDYNYAVLKRREDENTIIRNQQKRRINRLQDVINNLKKTHTEVDESTKQEIQKLTDQVLKSHKSILELMEKSESFTKVNETRYLQIWDMNIKTANELIDKILTADRIVHEQTLGIDWEPPDKSLLRKEDLPSYRDVMSKIEQQKREAEERKKIVDVHKPAATLDELNLERRMLNRIVEQISDRSGYLIEDSLREILLPYTGSDNLVIRLDNVFQALSIQTEEEVCFLLHFFLPYAYCTMCKNETSISSEVLCKSSESKSEEVSETCAHVCEKEELDENAIELIGLLNMEACADGPCTIPDVCVDNVSHQSSTLTSETSGGTECGSASTSANDSVQKYISKEVSQENRPQLLCDKGHLLTIETVHVTKALKEFVERFHFVKCGDAPPSFKERLAMNKLTVSRNLTEEDIKLFWQRYRDIFSNDKVRLWDALLVGLKKYYEVLKERHQLNLETESLRKQNAELRRLLKSYTVQPDNIEDRETDVGTVTSMT